MNDIVVDEELNNKIQEAVSSGKFSHIPTDELEQDKQDAYADIIACQAALKLGIKSHGGIDTQFRLDENKKQIVIIESELKRRSES